MLCGVHQRPTACWRSGIVCCGRLTPLTMRGIRVDKIMVAPAAPWASSLAAQCGAASSGSGNQCSLFFWLETFDLRGIS